jgi:hypothetical protein
VNREEKILFNVSEHFSKIYRHCDSAKGGELAGGKIKRRENCVRGGEGWAWVGVKNRRFSIDLVPRACPFAG